MVLYEDQLEHKFTVFVVLVLYFYVPTKNYVKLLLASSCLSVRTQQLGRLPLDRFARNFILEGLFENYIEKFQMSLESDENNM